MDNDKIISDHADAFFRSMQGWRIDKKQPASPLVSLSFKEAVVRQYRALVQTMIIIGNDIPDDEERKKASVYALNTVAEHIMATNDWIDYIAPEAVKRASALRIAGGVLAATIKTCNKLNVPCAVDPEFFGISQTGLAYF